MKERYRQHLPDLELSLERNTDRVPNDDQFYLLQGSLELGTFRSLNRAQAEWRRVVAESGWRPQSIELDAKELLAKEDAERERQRYNEYWGSSHNFRG